MTDSSRENKFLKLPFGGSVPLNTLRGLSIANKLTMPVGHRLTVVHTANGAAAVRLPPVPAPHPASSGVEM